MRFGIVGCGLIGGKRLDALSSHRVVAVADTEPARANALAERAGARVSASWEDVVHDPEIDAVVVATTNDWLAPVALAAIEAGKHVLVEKPAARSSEELEPLIAARERRGVSVHVGFNHRFHPALRDAHRIVHDDGLLPLMFVRGRYGHGGRLGYELEWRAQKETAGGGELIDQGIHLIDLARWFLGDVELIDGIARTYYWDMSVDDNAFLSLQTARGQTAWLHVSCTEWKNMFSLELYGRTAKLQIDGLGGSYGVERLTYYQMRPEMGPPDTTIWEYPGADSSFRLECESFVAAAEQGTPTAATLEDAKAALDIVGRVYQSAGL